ncbi:MAG: PilZ domain-containing protein [Clostridiales bacterium]|nr:PilZ domain-containing protein [Clostridiales bacterium]
MNLSQVVNLGEMLKIEMDEIVAKTKLQDIIDDDSFIAFQPTIHGIPLRAKDSEPMRFSFCRDNGIFVFDAIMEKSFTMEELQVCKFRVVSKVTKHQRRNSYRLPITLDTTLKLIEPEVEAVKDEASFKVKTSNISDSGMLFTSFDYFPSKMLVNAFVMLEEKRSLSLSAKVVRCYQPSNKTKKYNVSLQFVNLSTKDQALLSRFILRMQIRKHKVIRP